MKHITTFEQFLNESSNARFDIAKLVNGNIKELITGNLQELVLRFSSAIDDATAFNKKLSDSPKTIEELLEIINLAQKLKDKFRGNTEYKKWNKAKGEPIDESFNPKYWEDYHEGSTKITSKSAVARAVEDAVEDWNDNNDMGKDNEVTQKGEMKVMELAYKFFAAKGWVSSDVIEAFIAQES